MEMLLYIVDIPPALTCYRNVEFNSDIKRDLGQRRESSFVIYVKYTQTWPPYDYPSKTLLRSWARCSTIPVPVGFRYGAVCRNSHFWPLGAVITPRCALIVLVFWSLALFIRRWFVGGISRLAAESRLRPLESGAFLIRESESTPGEFSVSVRYTHTLTHTVSVFFRVKL